MSYLFSEGNPGLEIIETLRNNPGKTFKLTAILRFSEKNKSLDCFNMFMKRNSTQGGLE